MAAKRAAAEKILAGPSALTASSSTTRTRRPSRPRTTVPPTATSSSTDRRLGQQHANATTTGVDRIDLWVGGLAEKQFVFGGLLGSTFNYVFEQQMEDLQFGDRFYYLSRTAGLNMLTQLEGNSFSELIQRNTDVEGLPADSFSRPALTFDLAKLGTTGPVLDDPATEWNEATLLTRMPDGTFRYGGPEHVVFNGTAGNNRVWSSEGDDTIRGNDGNDWMQGGDGNDNHIGGLGDDILLDTNGDDTLKGGDGNDTLSSGQGFAGDLNQGGRGNDFIDHDDMAEAFAGPGDDWFLGGPEDDTVFGDDGDDWLENGATVTGTGGGAFNLLQGDNGAPFQDDPNEPGHDVLIGYGGETDYDSRGRRRRHAARARDPAQRGHARVRLRHARRRPRGSGLATWTSPVCCRRAWRPTRTGSTSSSRCPGGTSTTPCAVTTVTPQRWWATSSTAGGHRPRGRVSAPSWVAPPPSPAATSSWVVPAPTSSRVAAATTSSTATLSSTCASACGAVSPTGRRRQIDSVETLAGVSARLLAGTVNPGQLRIVREIQTPVNGTAVDTAVFSGPRADYDITFGATATTVVHARGTALDGTDTLRNIEQLQFSDRTIPNAVVPVVAASAPTGLTATLGATNVAAGDGRVNLAFTAPADDGGAAITGFRIQVRTGTTVVSTVDVAATPTTAAITGLTGGTAYNFRVRAITSFGLGVLSVPSATVTPVTLAPAPGNPRRHARQRLGGPDVDGTAGHRRLAHHGLPRPGPHRQHLGANRHPDGNRDQRYRHGLTNGTAYNFRVRAVTAAGLGALSAQSNIVTPATVPGAPVIGTAVTGAPGGAITATANWAAPANNGGSAITGYRVFALQFNAAGTLVATTQSVVQPATARTLQMTLAAGNYRFQVTAINAVGRACGRRNPTRWRPARGSLHAVDDGRESLRATAVVTLHHQGQLHGDAHGRQVLQPVRDVQARGGGAGDQELDGHQQRGRWSQDGCPDRHGTLTSRSEAVVDLHPSRDRLRLPAQVTAFSVTDIPSGNRTDG